MKPKVIPILCLAALALCPVGCLAQGAKKAHPPHIPKNHVLKTPAQLEQFILNDLGLSASQHRETNHLLDRLMSQIKNATGLGLAPRDPKQEATQLQAFRKEYMNGLKRTLTATQFKHYMTMHEKVAAAIRRSQQPGMHF